jgi:hypothetical protein
MSLMTGNMPKRQIRVEEEGLGRMSVCSSRRNVSRDNSRMKSVLIRIKRKDSPRLALKIVKQHKIEVVVEGKCIMMMKGKEKVGDVSLRWVVQGQSRSCLVEDSSQLMTIFTCTSLPSQHRPTTLAHRQLRLQFPHRYHTLRWFRLESHVLWLV